MKKIPLAIALALIATLCVMRAPITSVGPVAPVLQQALSMSHSTYGALQALPVLALGSFGLLTAFAARSLKVNVLVAALCLTLTLGIFLRITDSVVLLFAGTIAIGGSIAMLNNLMPVFVRHYFQEHITLAMSLLTAAIGVSSCLGSAFSYPVFSLLGSYKYSIGIWIIPAGLATLLWLVSMGKKLPEFQEKNRLDLSPLKRLPAWSVIMTMSMQSLAMYTVIAWLPVLVISKGISASEASSATALFVIFTAVASFFTTLCIRMARGERSLSLWLTAMFLAGIACWLTNSYALILLGSVLTGFSQGVRFSLAVILVAKKSEALSQMLTLSAISQGLGYFIAALGPYLCGLLFVNDGLCLPVMIFMTFVTLLWGLAAWYGFGPCKVFAEN